MKTWQPQLGFGAVLLICLSLQALAEEKVSINSIPPNQIIQYDGVNDPESVPIHIRLETFVQTYDGQLDSRLSKNDRTLLITAIRKLAWLEGLYTALAQIFRQNTVCDGFASGVDLVLLAQEVQNFDDEDLDRKRLVMEQFYSSLSKTGQEVIAAEIAEFVLPNIYRSQLSNFVEIVRSKPDRYAARLEDLCSDQPKLRGFYVEERLELSRDGDTVEFQIVRRIK